ILYSGSAVCISYSGLQELQLPELHGCFCAQRVQVTATYCRRSLAPLMQVLPNLLRSGFPALARQERSAQAQNSWSWTRRLRLAVRQGNRLLQRGQVRQVSEEPVSRP